MERVPVRDTQRDHHGAAVLDDGFVAFSMPDRSDRRDSAERRLNVSALSFSIHF